MILIQRHEDIINDIRNSTPNTSRTKLECPLLAMGNFQIQAGISHRGNVGFTPCACRGRRSPPSAARRAPASPRGRRAAAPADTPAASDDTCKMRSAVPRITVLLQHSLMVTGNRCINKYRTHDYSMPKRSQTIPGNREISTVLVITV